MVMALLSVLFVTGIVFLTTMSFEAEMISADRQRTQTETAVRSVLRSVDGALRQGLMGAPGTPFGGKLDEPFAPQFVGVLQSNLGDAPQAIGEIPGIHNVFSPIEPFDEDGDPGTLFDLEYLWHTDARAVFGSPQAMPFVQVAVPSMLPSGIPDPNFDIGIPVDSDGDGITDTFQHDVTQLGFSDAQIRTLARAVNAVDNPDGNVFLGLRVVPHGGMVNLNESHPLMIANVLDFRCDGGPNNGQVCVDPLDCPGGQCFPWEDGLRTACDPAGDPNCTFNHRPTLRGAFYSSVVEEPLLRRRGLLPPVGRALSLLHGSPHNTDVATGGGDMAAMLFPPIPSNDPFRFDPNNVGFETIFSGRHRFWPFTLRQNPNGSVADPLNPSDPMNSPPVWPFRMEPSFTLNANDGINSPDYDRRHLLTTISHDSLLARGGRVVTQFDDAANPLAEMDLREAMIRSNQLVDCPNEDRVVFEYANYPHDVANNTAPGATTVQQQCDDVCPASEFCRFDPVKGRLQLSLSWLDGRGVRPDGSPCNAFIETSNCAWFGNVVNLFAAGFSRLEVERMIRLLHDAFFMLVRNASGKYWEDIDCSLDASLCDPWGGVCRPVGASVCAGGPNDGQPCTSFADCPLGSCVTQQMCHDAVTGLRHREALISRAAASLTANMIDYADFDEVPTRVALRSFDFTDPRRAGRPYGRCDAGPNADRPCVIPQDCPQSFCDSLRPIYVYGLERQPFITEVASFAESVGGEQPVVTARAVELFNPYDAELTTLDEFVLYEVNPEASDPIATANRIELNNLGLPPAGQGGPFTVIATGATAELGLTGPEVMDDSGTRTGTAHLSPAGVPPLTFKNGWILYLVRRVRYGDEPPTEIVVDQFRVTDDVAKEGAELEGAVEPFWFALERIVPDVANVPGGSIWTAPVPETDQSQFVSAQPPEQPLDVVPGSLGTWNKHFDPNIRPVEVRFPNTGSFTQPPDPALIPVNPGDENAVAFPTTGSMLFLTRHANRSLRELTGCVDSTTGPTGAANVPTGAACAPTGGCAEPTAVCRTVNEDLAFTTWLDRVTEFREFDPVSGAQLPVKVEEKEQIDNGRMPVFDQPRRECVGFAGTTGVRCTTLADCPSGQTCEVARPAVHHIDPSTGACCLPPPDECLQTRAARCPDGVLFVPGGRCNLDSCNTQINLPGSVRDLPWGLLVFDYFTTLPLSSEGPYAAEDFDARALPDSIPRVDQNGLRVHGRVNLNAAPWKVLAGTPYVPMGRMPAFTREQNRICDVVELDCTDPAVLLRAVPIGRRMAASIVGYREMRNVDLDSSKITANPISETTGDYNEPRGWDVMAPEFRRGPGLLTIGELANLRILRNPDPDSPDNAAVGRFRIDRGELVFPAPDYVRAVGRLAALGEWVTVRSDVFTVFGTLRGEMDPLVLGENPTQQLWELAAADVDSRAIRFQETVDRLPAFLGSRQNHTVGRRVVAGYLDVFSD